MSDTTLNTFLSSGTAAERAAFTPNPATPASGNDPTYFWFETDTGDSYAWDFGGSAWNKINALSAADTPYSICDGRLTTETGVAVSTSDRTAQGTLYWTPFLSKQIGLYSGSAWVMFTQAELSLALTLTSGKNYDVFVDYNGGTPALALSAAWTNDTTRADALTTQDGVIVKSGSTGKRWVGTIRASGANVTEDSITKRFVWNYYNQVRRQMFVADTTSSWTYTTNTWRQANAAATNQVEYVSGSSYSLVSAVLHATSATANASAVTRGVAVGVDSTTTPATGNFGGVNNTYQNARCPHVAYYAGYPGLGYHTVVYLEASTATSTTTWFGDVALGGSTIHENGLQVIIRN